MAVMPKEKVEKLLAEVQQIKAIYDPQDDYYKDNTYLNKEWTRIALGLNMTLKTCRQKWKNMLSKMRTQLKKFPKPRSGAGASEKKSRWKWYNAMLFVTDYQQPKASSGNLTKALQQEKHRDDLAEFEDDGEEYEEDLESDLDDSDAVEEVEVAVEPPCKKTKMLEPKESGSSTSHSNSMKPAKQSFAHLAEVNDEMFFETLLVDTRRMSRPQKIHFRNQIIELVLRFSHNRRGLLSDWEL